MYTSFIIYDFNKQIKIIDNHSSLHLLLYLLIKYLNYNK